MSDNNQRRRIEQAKKTLQEWNLPQVDQAALIDYIDRLDERGYHDKISLEPEEKVDDVVFEVALAVGYDLGLRDVAEGTSNLQ